MLKKKIAAVVLSVVITVSSCLGLTAYADEHDGEDLAKFGSGDVNSDGVIDTSDALFALRISLGHDNVTDDQYNSADINGDGIVNSSDALSILQIAVTQLASKGRALELGEAFALSAPVNGIDVSLWQGDIDFNKVKADGIDFVIIRAGGGTGDPKDLRKDFDVRRQGIDPYFEQNYARAKAAGLNVGVYWYSFADTKEMAEREAAVCLKQLEGKQFEYPVFYDVENEFQLDKGRDFCSEIMETFCSIIRDNGYYAAFYMSAFWATTCLNDHIKTSYDCWIAQWSEPVTYAGSYGMWQKGLSQVDGVYGDVDFDVSFTNYPLYIKTRRLNGW